MLTKAATAGYHTFMMKAMSLARRKKREMMEMATLKLVRLPGVNHGVAQPTRGTHVADQTRGTSGRGRWFA